MRPPLTRDVDRAADALRAGALVGLPTETVYGLAARADDEEAVRRIFAVKRRPAASPLIVHLADAAALDAWAVAIPTAARALAAAFWPGPLTVVLATGGRAAPAVVAGRGTVALRVPAHPLARAAIAAIGPRAGVAAPSANRHGAVSATTAEHVAAAFAADEVACVLDGGPSAVGVESTIVDLTRGGARILRPGGVAPEAIRAVLHAPAAIELEHLATAALGEAAVAVPGQARSHYAPAARVELAADVATLVAQAVAGVRAGLRVGVLACASRDALAAAGLPADAVVLRAETDPGAVAHALFGDLHAADAAGLELVVALPPDGDGIALAVRDRLARAAAPR